MRQLDKYTLNVRRESLLKAIRSQQREQFKADRRATLLEHHARARQADEIYRFRLALFTLNLSNEQGRVLEVLRCSRSSSPTSRSAPSARSKTNSS
jgi:hypothetical protein